MVIASTRSKDATRSQRWSRVAKDSVDLDVGLADDRAPPLNILFNNFSELLRCSTARRYVVDREPLLSFRKPQHSIDVGVNL